MKLRGFTLAEVLITLGIIGVIAAMTLPTLIKIYQIRVLKAQFEVAQYYSTSGQKDLFGTGCRYIE